MRGTGCSGGAFDFFEPLQGLDGYDVIETIARQPWVAERQGRDDGHLLRRHQPALHRRDQPAEPGRDLAAVGDRQHADDALPGRHPQHRLRARVGEGARPRRRCRRRPTAARRWAYQRIQEGDQTCADNQDAAPRGGQPAGEDPAPTTTTSRRSPTRSSPVTFVHKINVPVFMACQWTDEQTGGHCPTLAGALHRHRAQVVHVHQRHPRRLARPGDASTAGTTSSSSTSPSRRRSSNSAADQAGGRRSSTRRRWGSRGVTLPRRPDPAAADLRRGLGAFEELQPVRILFDNGAGGPRRAARTRASSSRSRASRSPGTQGALVVPRATAALGDASRPRAAASGPVHAGTPRRRPPTDFTGDTAGGDRRPVDRDAAVRLDAEPGRHRGLAT